MRMHYGPETWGYLRATSQERFGDPVYRRFKDLVKTVARMTRKEIEEYHTRSAESWIMDNFKDEGLLEFFKKIKGFSGDSPIVLFPGCPLENVNGRHQFPEGVSMDRDASDFSPLFQPLSVGRGMKKLILKNRMVMAPMVTCLADSFGEVTQRLVDYHVKRAKGGVGTIIVEAMDIDERIFPNRLGIFHDRFINELEYLALSIRENGAAAVAQINHAGPRGNLPGPDELNRGMVEEIGKGASWTRSKGSAIPGRKACISTAPGRISSSRSAGNSWPTPARSMRMVR